MPLKAGLLLTTSAVFITTVPPNPSILDYTRAGPYTVISIAFGLFIGTIIVSAICILAGKKLTAKHTAEVRGLFILISGSLSITFSGTLWQFLARSLYSDSHVLSNSVHCDCGSRPRIG